MSDVKRMGWQQPVSSACAVLEAITHPNVLTSAYRRVPESSDQVSGRRGSTQRTSQTLSPDTHLDATRHFARASSPISTKVCMCCSVLALVAVLRCAAVLCAQVHATKRA